MEGDVHEDPVIRTTNTGARKCPCPHFATCEAGKMFRKSMNKSGTATKMKLKENILHPGELYLLTNINVAREVVSFTQKGRSL